MAQIPDHDRYQTIPLERDRSVRRFKYSVTGRGVFPFDMLRYDGAWPASSSDAAMLYPDVREMRTVVLIGSTQPTFERWASFLWSVGHPERPPLTEQPIPAPEDDARLTIVNFLLGFEPTDTEVVAAVKAKALLPDAPLNAMKVAISTAARARAEALLIPTATPILT